MKDSTNPVEKRDKKNEEESNRVFRGGYWIIIPYYVRASSRGDVSPANRNNRIGFRLVKNKSKT
jgi:formylglycine-generating enzyme required for sulfatase activity